MRATKVYTKNKLRQNNTERYMEVATVDVVYVIVHEDVLDTNTGLQEEFEKGIVTFSLLSFTSMTTYIITISYTFEFAWG